MELLTLMNALGNMIFKRRMIPWKERAIAKIATEIGARIDFFVRL